MIPGPLKQAAAWKKEAVTVAREVVEMYPEDAISYALLGSAFFNIGQSKEAVENLRRCIDMDPRQADAYEILARVAYDKGELQEAVHLCEQGLKNGGQNPLMLNRLGRSLLDLGRPLEAIPVLEKTLRLPGRSSESFYLLGQAHMQAGDHEQARKSFQGDLLNGRRRRHSSAGHLGNRTGRLRQRRRPRSLHRLWTSPGHGGPLG